MSTTGVEILLFRVAGRSAIPQFRRYVLDMAIRGQFDRRGPGDLSTDEVERELRQLRIAGRHSGAKAALLIHEDPIGAEELPSPYAICTHVVRLRDIATLSKGPTGIKDARAGQYPLVVTAERRSSCDHFDFEGSAVVIPMVSSTGHGDASLKRIHYQEGRFAVGSILCAILPLRPDLISARFLFEYLAAFKDELLVARMIGTANVSLTVYKIGEIPVPLASPFAQRRVEELMKLCDALEQGDRLADDQHARLTSTLFDALATSQSAHELAENWQRVAEHFDLLLDRPEAIEELERAVLALAMQGRLVPQDAADESTDLHSAAGSSPEPIKENELPFEIPESWQWIRIGWVAELINGDRGKNYPNKAEYVASGLPFINTGHIEPDGTLSQKSMNYLTRHKFDSLRSGKTRAGDLVYCLRGATLGKTAIVDYAEGAIASSLVIIRMNEAVDRKYAYYFLTGPLGRDLIKRFDNGSAQPNLAANSVKRYVMPLPPVTEQRRIVARVEELRRLCTELRKRLIQAGETQSRLADALLAEVA